MEQTRASVTALGAALMRAVHSRLAPSPLIDDPSGDRIVLQAEREAVLSVVQATEPAGVIATNGGS